MPKPAERVNKGWQSKEEIAVENEQLKERRRYELIHKVSIHNLLEENVKLSF